MELEYQRRPYRPCVGIMLINSNNQIFAGQRIDNHLEAWQMPQGGVDKGESYLSAMKRELFEETNISSIKVLKELDRFFEYELPNNLIGIIWKGKYRGQKQKWFITKFIGEEKEINLKTQHQEFVEWKWIPANNLPEVILNFKKEMYLELLKDIKKFIG